MDIPDSETTQAIDLAALRGEYPRKPKREKFDLYEVSADNVYADSLIGLVRQNNEDCYACCTKKDGHLSMLAVADGIGGSDSGELASSICIAALVRAWRAFTKKYQDTTWEDAQNFLMNAIDTANEIVYRESLLRNNQMGTTVAVLQSLPYERSRSDAIINRSYARGRGPEPR